MEFHWCVENFYPTDLANRKMNWRIISETQQTPLFIQKFVQRLQSRILKFDILSILLMPGKLASSIFYAHNFSWHNLMKSFHMGKP